MGQQQPQRLGHPAIYRQAMAVVVIHLYHRAWGRPQHPAGFLPVLRPGEAAEQAVPELYRSGNHLGLLLPGKGQLHHIPEGGAVLHPAQLQLQLIKAFVILPGCQGDNLMLRHQGLDDGLPRQVSPPGSAHHLGEHIEGGLPSPEAVVI